MDPDKEARIRERAYEIWISEGRPHGRDAEHWQKAEAEIMAESGAADQAAAGSKPNSQTAGNERPIPGPAAGPALPLRSRRAAPKPGGGNLPEGGAAPRRGRKKPES